MSLNSLTSLRVVVPDVHPDATVKSQQLITPVVTVFVEFKDDATADNALHKFQTVQKTLLKDRCAKGSRSRCRLVLHICENAQRLLSLQSGDVARYI